jgi:hypothetical protein
MPVDVVEVFRTAQVAPAGHRDRGKGVLAQGGESFRESPADCRIGKTDRRHEPLFGSYLRAAAPWTQTSCFDRCLGWEMGESKQQVRKDHVMYR